MTSAQEGDTCIPFTNNRCDSIIIEISGTFEDANASVVFEGKTDLNVENYTTLWGVELSGSGDLTSTATKHGIWIVNLSGIQIFRARVASISGGDITVMGRCVSTAN